MRIVATSDTHYPPFNQWQDQHLNTIWSPTVQIPDGDVFVHAGDLLRTGYPDEWPAALEWLERLPHKIKLYVPGNHDFHLQVYPGPALQELRSINVTCVGLPGNDNYVAVRLPNGMNLLGLPYVVNLPRWAMNTDEAALADHLMKVWSPHTDVKYDVVVSHSPVSGFLDRNSEGVHTGISAYLKHIYKLADSNNEHYQLPKVWICGHIHESYGRTSFGGIDFYNVAMCDRNYTHVNPPVVIDL